MELLLYFLASVGLIVITFICLFMMQAVRDQVGGHKNYTRIARTDGKSVLITGCDSGFGYELACRLDKLGCMVFATCLTKDGVTNLNANCSSRLRAVQMDVTNMQDVKAAFEFVKESLENPGSGTLSN